MKQSPLSHLRPLRLWIAPPGSRRETFLMMVRQGLTVWKNEGLVSVYRKARRRFSEWTTARDLHKTAAVVTDQVQKERHTNSLLDLRTIAKVQSIPTSYDVILLTGKDWRWNSGRFRQFAGRFAQDGHRVFHILEINKEIKTRVRLVEERIFEVQLPRLHSNPADEQWLTARQKVFAALRDELGIVDAVCLVDLPFWGSTVFSLRDSFGWKIIYDCPSIKGGNQLYNEEERLIQRSDLVLVRSQALFNELEQDRSDRVLVADKEGYERVRQIIPSLFPKASIIVVTYNNVDFTRLCLESIYEKTIYPNFEVIVVDNASSDETPEFLRAFAARHDNIHIQFNTENLGFSGANNQGIAAAQGDYIVLLNNDTVVTSIWLSRLIAYLKDRQLGLIGSMTNGVWNEARIEMPYTDISALDGFATELARVKSNVLTSIRMLAMYCVAGCRDVFEHVGPLDEQFGIGMFEDDDFSLRMRQAGYRVAVAEDVFIHHFGQSGFKTLGDERYLALFDENKNKFEAKWKIKWHKYKYEPGSLAENRQYSTNLQAILNEHPDAPGVVIFPLTSDSNLSLFPRIDEVAASLTKMGFLVFLHTEDKVDDRGGFKQISPNLYRTNCPGAIFDLVPRPIVFALPNSREYAFQLRQPLMVYEVPEDPDINSGEAIPFQQERDLLLQEADIVIAKDRSLIERAEKIRTNSLVFSTLSELEHSFPLDVSGVGFTPHTSSIPAAKTDKPIVCYFSVKPDILSRSLQQVKPVVKVYEKLAGGYEEPHRSDQNIQAPIPNSFQEKSHSSTQSLDQ